MKLYVIERITDYCYQLGCHTDYNVALQQLDEYRASGLEDCYIEEYEITKNKWCEFE